MSTLDSTQSTQSEQITQLEHLCSQDIPESRKDWPAFEQGNKEPLENALSGLNAQFLNDYSRDTDSFNFLQIAAYKGNHLAVELLLKANADPNKPITIDANDYCKGDTPLHIAASNRYISTIKALYKDSRIEPNKCDLRGFTPAYALVQDGQAVDTRVHLALLDHPYMDPNAPQTASEKEGEYEPLTFQYLHYAPRTTAPIFDKEKVIPVRSHDGVTFREKYDEVQSKLLTYSALEGYPKTVKNAIF